jgi:hypothetical protein
MRGRTLTQLLESVRLESGRSSSTTLGQNEEPALKQRINRIYEFFWFDHSWPHLKIMDADKSVAAGVYEFDPPTAIDLETIEKVACRFGDKWHPMGRGINTELYNALDSEADERSFPIENYDIQYTGAAAQIVVWPRPSQDTTVRFQGRRAFAKLVNGSDVCYLDDQIIYLHAAAELLAKAEDPMAESMASAARRRLNIMKYGLGKNRNSKFNLGGQQSVEPSKRGQGEVRVAIAPVSE